jgi:hypothetical protein
MPLTLEQFQPVLVDRRSPLRGLAYIEPRHILKHILLPQQLQAHSMMPPFPGRQRLHNRISLKYSCRCTFDVVLLSDFHKLSSLQISRFLILPFLVPFTFYSSNRPPSPAQESLRNRTGA